jgi:hypothetical protein
LGILKWLLPPLLSRPNLSHPPPARRVAPHPLPPPTPPGVRALSTRMSLPSPPPQSGRWGKPCRNGFCLALPRRKAAPPLGPAWLVPRQLPLPMPRLSRAKGRDRFVCDMQPPPPSDRQVHGLMADACRPPPGRAAPTQPLSQPRIQEGGWQVISRHRQWCRLEHRPPLPPQLRRPVPVDLVGRYFKCLKPDHVAVPCTFAVRCLRCHGEGHQARTCKRPWSSDSVGPPP